MLMCISITNSYNIILLFHSGSLFRIQHYFDESINFISNFSVTLIFELIITLFDESKYLLKIFKDFKKTIMFCEDIKYIVGSLY